MDQEHDSSPDFVSGFSFSALSIADNIFLSGDVAPWFSYIVIKPHGAGHYLNGVNVTGNMFRSINGSIDRAERVDTSFADLEYTRFKNVTFVGNTYHAVSSQVMNPLRVRHKESSAAKTWTVEAGGELPFGGRARGVDGIVTLDAIKTGDGDTVHDLPYVELEQGGNGDKVKLVWSKAVKGEVAVSLRIDT